MRIRVAPLILVRGETQVKGQRFDNWRAVGTGLSAARLQAARDVDELFVIDVGATARGQYVSERLVAQIAEFIRIPLCVGGGIRTISQISALLRAGADKVLIGAGAAEVDGLLERASAEFGSQALVVSVDVIGDGQDMVVVKSGSEHLSVNAKTYAAAVEAQGAGEVLLQDVSRDGMMLGMNTALISAVRQVVDLPIIAATGMGNPSHAVEAVDAGASAIATGAMLQFTSYTPKDVKDSLSTSGFAVRH